MILLATEVSNHYNEFVFGVKEITNLFDKASHEALTIMIFFQVISVSFVILKFSSLLNLVVWLSFAFLMYTLAGPYMFFKWFILLSSSIWHFCLILWTHPYLLASVFFTYGIYRLFKYFSCSFESEPEHDQLSLILMKLQEMEKRNESLTDKVSNMCLIMENMKTNQCCNKTKESESEDSANESPYPMDRRRTRSMSAKKLDIDSKRKLHLV